MISNTFDRKVCIHITTYKENSFQKDHEMDEKNHKKICKANNFICTICLNTKRDNRNGDNKKLSKTCPICQKSCDYCQNTTKGIERKDTIISQESNVKNVQTSDTNVTQGLNLLNEVLTVFQHKKVDTFKDKAKPGTSKDIGVSTEDYKRKDCSRLTINNFYYSIDATKMQESSKFTVLSSCQPSFLRKSQYSADLIYHKSSSIPQMKLEELKHTLKEKTRSKDAIEEVNRMFATVRKSNSKAFENSNRPMIRNGPRVLPVVKTLPCQEVKYINFDNMEKFCKCCQTCLSSGDSFLKPECCHGHEQCYKSVCCHYQKRKQQADVICDHCQSINEGHICEHDLLTDDCC